MRDARLQHDRLQHDRETLQQVLADLRRRIRWYVAAEAWLLTLLLSGLLFWLGLLGDWFLEPSPTVRKGVYLAWGVTTLVILVEWGLRRWITPLSDRSLALLLERQHAELADRLTTAVDLARSEEHGEPLHPELVARTTSAAAEAAQSLSLWRTLDGARLGRLAMGVVGLLLGVVVLSTLAPAVWQTYTQRLALSPEPWPRRVSLAMEEVPPEGLFQPDGEGGWVRKVPRHSDVVIAVAAELEHGHEIPDRVTIRYRWANGPRGYEDLVRIGNAQPGRDAAQRYEYLFERITNDVSFEIRGGDDRLRGFRLEVVERPKVTALVAECEYPRYLQRATRPLPVAPRMELPAGCRLRFTGEANKPLEQITWQVTSHRAEEPVPSESRTERFVWEFDLGGDDAQLGVSLRDQDGITSQELFRTFIAARVDQPPQLSLQRQGVGLAVTPQAKIPVELTVQEDYRVKSAWLELQVDQGSPLHFPLELPVGSAEEVVLHSLIDLRKLPQGVVEESPEAQPETVLKKGKGESGLVPGQRLTLLGKADDFCDLDDQSRTGVARSLSLEVVTEEELLARLSQSEQNLRQTFESIADKLVEVYATLDHAMVTAAVATTDEATTTATTDAELVGDPDPLSEVSRAAERVHQLAAETRGVAAGFHDIFDQLQNNRVEQPELRDRIGRRLAVPLQQLGEEQMAAVAAQLTAIEKDSAAVREVLPVLQEVIAEVERLLREMQGLENYQEVIALLRDIIRQQEELTEKTQQQQQSEVRRLLLD